jgi:2-keto-4-pentenoate hydratase/2-oxohepta-3-ene-1,7-dioic acid hydratase in catechol pathway
MKLVRFTTDAHAPATAARGHHISYGALEGESIRVISGDPFGEWALAGPFVEANSVRLLPPCVPSKIVCVGRNYVEHAKELHNEVPTEPLIFLKPPSSLLEPGGAIVYPRLSQRVDHEGEIGVIIGKRCRRLAPGARAADYIYGYTCVNDVTARDLQKKDGQWTRGKGFDTFCPFGPCIRTDVDAAALAVQGRVNGEVRQAGHVSEMIFPIEVILRYISQVMTLEPGDLIATGTPAGVGPLKVGDTVEVVIDGVGVLRNTVIGETSAS